MTTDIATLGIRVDSSDVKNATSELDKLTNAGAKTEKATNSLAVSFGGLKTALAGLGIGAIAKEAIDLADTYANVQGRLSLVTSGTSELSAVTDKLFASAQRARVGFEATADLYSSLARSTKALGTSQGDLLQVTETINKALIVSGASAATAEGALTQLAQGFASGTLRGDELNSVLEGTPRLAQAIADGMNVTVGQLRALGGEGKITGETVFNALKTQREAVEKEFAQMPTTVAQSFTVLQNEILKYVGEANKANGATAAMAQGIKVLADNLDVIIPLVASLGVALGVGFVSRAVAAQVAAAGAAGGMASMGVAARAAGASMLSAFGGPVGIAITGVTLALGGLIAENSKAAAMTAGANKAYDDMQRKLLQSKSAADAAKSGTANLSTAIDKAAPGYDLLTGKVKLLAGWLYTQADAAKKARIEIAQSALAEAKANEAKAMAATAGARRDNNSRQQLRDGDFLGLAGTTYSYVMGAGRSALSGGRTDREAQENYSKYAAATRYARKQLAEAYTSSNSEINTASKVNEAEINKLKGQISDLRKLRETANAGERKRIDKQIGNRERKVTLLGTGAAEDAVNAAVGSASSGGSKEGKSDAQREYESAVEASKSYVAQLQVETAGIGKNETQLRLADAAREAAKAPTTALKQEILASAAVLADATLGYQIAEGANKALAEQMEAAAHKQREQVEAGKLASEQVEFETRLLSMNAEQRARAIAIRDLERQGVVAGTLAYDLYASSILKAADAHGAANLNADNAHAFADAMKAVNDNVRLATDSFGELFGTAGEGFAGMVASVADYAERVSSIEARVADERARHGAGSIEARRAEAQAGAELATAEAAHYGNMLRSAKGFFKQKSEGYKLVEAAEKAYSAVKLALAVKEIVTEGLLTTTKVAGAGARMAVDGAETASSVTNSGTRAAADGVAAFAKTLASLPFPFNIAAGAAVLAALVGVGVAISGGGGKGASATASATPEPAKPRDYANEDSPYSVLQSRPGYGTGSNNVGSFANDNRAAAPAAAQGGGNFSYNPTYNIDAPNADDTTVDRIRDVLAEHQADTVQKARAAMQQDRVNAAGRQFIGGGVN